MLSGEETQHVPIGNDRRIHSRRLDRVHDGLNRCHRTGPNTATVRDFERHIPGTDNYGEFDHAGFVDDNNHDTGCSDDNPHDYHRIHHSPRSWPGRTRVAR